MDYLIIVATSSILYLYYSNFTKLDKTISIYHLFPSQSNIDKHRVILYSRVNYKNVDTCLKNKNMLYLYNIKEHSKRLEKIGIYIRLRISNKIKLKLKNWVNHIRYKPGSMIFKQLSYKWNKNNIFNYQIMDKNVQNPIKGKYKPDFDFKKIKINDVGRYSITRPYEAKQIILYIQNEIKNVINKESKDCIVTDGTSGVGGDTLHFSKYFKNVNAVDILEENTKLLKENCDIFKITNVNIICSNYINICNKLKQDVLYLDPPWGGIGYKDKQEIDLFLDGLDISQVVNKLESNPMIFLKLPLNSNLNKLNILKKFIILNKKNHPSFYLVLLKQKSE